MVSMGGNIARYLKEQDYTVAALFYINATIANELAFEIGATAYTTPAVVTFEQNTKRIEISKGELDKSGIAELTFKGHSA